MNPIVLYGRRKTQNVNRAIESIYIFTNTIVRIVSTQAKQPILNQSYPHLNTHSDSPTCDHCFLLFMLSSSLLNVNNHLWSTISLHTPTYIITQYKQNKAKTIGYIPLKRKMNNTKPPILSFRERMKNKTKQKQEK